MDNDKKVVTGEAGKFDYNDVVSTLREAARDELRLLKTNSVRAKIFSLTAELNEFLLAKKDLEKDLACANFDLSKIDPADPRAADFKEALDLDIKETNDEIKGVDAAITEMNGLLKEANDKLIDVQDGVWKVSIEALDMIVNRMIIDRSKAVVASKLS